MADESQTDSTPTPVVSKGMAMLAKMGWKQGVGLGRDNQGIAQPLTITVAGSGEGKIIDPNAMHQSASNLQPSNVILLLVCKFAVIFFQKIKVWPNLIMSSLLKIESIEHARQRGRG